MVSGRGTYAAGMFVDSAIITVRAGHGGAGAVAFRRQKYEPKGGPKGGDGGRGGDVVLYADEGCNTLLDFRGRPDWEAEAGGDGSKKQQTGTNGSNCMIKVPPGTMVYDNKSGDLIVDMAPKQKFVIAMGGNGGFGNEHYKSAVNQTPTHHHPGFEGQKRELRLELKLLADVGLLGMPNAGKSTLLASLTKANPKIADYPFTTLAPQLGVAELDATRRLVIADIPGLIEGASQGAGLGLDFLRHVERTRVLVHMLDAIPPEGTPAEHYRVIRAELYNYSPVLAEREEIIVLNKLDLLESDEAREAAVKDLRKELKLGREVEVLGISAATRKGTRELLERLWRLLNSTEHTWDGLGAKDDSKQLSRKAQRAVQELARVVQGVDGRGPRGQSLNGTAEKAAPKRARQAAMQELATANAGAKTGSAKAKTGSKSPKKQPHATAANARSTSAAGKKSAKRVVKSSPVFKAKTKAKAKARATAPAKGPKSVSRIKARPVAKKSKTKKRR